MTVNITQFRWAGKWGPFKVKSECEECEITTQFLKFIMESDFKDKDVSFELKPWLDNWIYCLIRKTWHPPIVMVNGKKFHQFSDKDPIFNKEKLVEHVNSLLEKDKT